MNTFTHLPGNPPEDNSEEFGADPNHSETFRSDPNRSEEYSGETHSAAHQPKDEQRGSEDFGNVPHGSEAFGTLPNRSAAFGTEQTDEESEQAIERPSGSIRRTENHILTVSEVAKKFDDAGVPRTERSITNWCRPNRYGEPRLDCYLDPNERRYFITPESAELAIKEEQAKAARDGKVSSAAFRKVPENENGEGSEETSDHGRSSAAKIRRLEIENEIKSKWIEKLEENQQGFIEKIDALSRHAGRLEGRVIEIDGADSSLLKLAPENSGTSPSVRDAGLGES